MHGLYPLFHRTLAFYFSRNGTKFTAYRSSLRTDVKKGLLHRNICVCFFFYIRMPICSFYIYRSIIILYTRQVFHNKNSYIYLLFRRSLAFCFSRNGTKFTALAVH